MAQKDIKNLTLSELKKQGKALDEKKEFTIDVGGQKYKLSYDVVFRNSKKSKLLDDMVKFFSESVDNIDILELSTPYTALLVLKHFTTLDVSDDISEALELLEVLIDLEILDKVLAELPEDQLTNVYELLTRTINSMVDNMAEVEAEAERLAEQVENPEVSDMIKDATNNL